MSTTAIEDGGTPDHVDTVAEMVAALRSEPVVVEPTMGNGFTEQVREHLLGLAEQATSAGVPVYVVATTTPVGLDPTLADEQIATLLHDALDVPGVYLVHTTLGSGSLRAFGDLGTGSTNTETELSLLRYDAAEQVDIALADRYGEEADSAAVVDLAAGLEATLEVAESGTFPEREYGDEPGVSPLIPVLSDARAESYTTAQWVYATPDYDLEQAAEPASAGLQAVVLTTTLALVALLTYRGLRAVHAVRWTRRTRALATPEASVDRDSAAALRGRAERRLRQVDTELTPGVASRLPAHLLDLARGSVEEGHRLLAVPVEGRDPDDARLEAVGAWVLAETAWAVVRSHGAGEPWRCCFLNPLHGAATTDEPLGRGLRAPVCSRCSADLRSGRDPDALTTGQRRLGRTRAHPYYDDDTIWARTGFGSLGEELWRELGRLRSRGEVER